MIMPNRKAFPSGALLWLAVASFSLVAATAAAGPQWTFGPDDESMLQLDYKVQFQMIYRDLGSGPDGQDSASQFNIRRNRLALMGELDDRIGI
jgi:hypothetical protein